MEAVQFGIFQNSKYLSEIDFHNSSDGTGINSGCNTVHIAEHTSSTILRIVVSPLLNLKLKHLKLFPVARYLKETCISNS
jgi:hypothetical protein